MHLLHGIRQQSQTLITALELDDIDMQSGGTENRG